MKYCLILILAILPLLACSSSKKRGSSSPNPRAETHPVESSQGRSQGNEPFDNSEIVATDKVLNDEEPQRELIIVPRELLLEAQNGEEYAFEVLRAWEIHCRELGAEIGDSSWSSKQQALARWEQARLDLADVQAGVNRQYNFVKIWSGGLPSGGSWVSGQIDSNGRYRWRTVPR